MAEHSRHVQLLPLRSRHLSAVTSVGFCGRNQTVISTCEHPDTGLILQQLNSKWKDYVFRVEKAGEACAAYVDREKCLVCISSRLTAGFVCVVPDCSTLRYTCSAVTLHERRAVEAAELPCTIYLTDTGDSIFDSASVYRDCFHSYRHFLSESFSLRGIVV